MEQMNIFQKMLKIQNEIGKVAKSLIVTSDDGSETYKAVSETDILEVVKPLEIKYGVYSYPYSRTLTVVEGSAAREVIVEVTYRFQNVDDKEDFIEITSYGVGLDSGDKAPGKAMTYADKYALMKAYKISTGEDPDVEHSPVDNVVTTQKLATPEQEAVLKELLPPVRFKKMLESCGIEKFEYMPYELAEEYILKLSKKK